jgi:asparagine synthase (glutamine-hydrolysing)
VRAKYATRPRALQPFTWLRPAALESMAEAMAGVEAHQPLSFAASVRMVPRRRTQTFALRNRRILAGPREVGIRCPLLDPDVVDALARDGGVLGRGDRTTVLRSLVADLLPDAILARTTKAEFGGAYMSVHTRSFAADWSGDGVDHDLVDAAELRRLWLSEDRIAPTAALLQAAWLGTHRPQTPSTAAGDVA